MGDVISFPSERRKRIPPRTTYGPRTLILRLTRVQGFPVRYRLESKDTTRPNLGWVCLHPDANFQTARQFIEHRRKNAYSFSLEWRLEDLTGDFGEYQKPYRSSGALVVYSDATLRQLRTLSRDDQRLFDEESRT